MKIKKSPQQFVPLRVPPSLTYHGPWRASARIAAHFESVQIDGWLWSFVTENRNIVISDADARCLIGLHMSITICSVK